MSVETVKQKNLSILGFSLFSAWHLAVPFQGQVLFSLLETAQNGEGVNPVPIILALFIGLFFCGFIVRKQIAAKVTMIVSTVVCISASLIFFLPFSLLWVFALWTCAFFSGLFIASWGYYLKASSPSTERFKTAADVLIYSNILMVLLNTLAVIISPYLALTLSILALITALFVIVRLDSEPGHSGQGQIITSKNEILNESISISSIRKSLVFLCLFIVVITLNSGLMYQVVNPSFSHLGQITSFFWAVPYIVALLILRNLPARINQAFILYSALAMIGLAFISFMSLDRTVTSYLVIDTLMLGAFGVCDLFWWSILASYLDYTHRPAQIFGVGLSMNVLGIMLGSMIANQIILVESDYVTASVIALVVIFVVLIMLPLLNALLARVFKDHVFLIDFASFARSEKKERVIPHLKYDEQLTDKESEVVELLLRGYTYKAISEKLYISENTMKFHVKNIYQKLNIKSKMQLIKMFSDQDN